MSLLFWVLMLDLAMLDSSCILLCLASFESCFGVYDKLAGFGLLWSFDFFWTFSNKFCCSPSSHSSWDGFKKLCVLAIYEDFGLLWCSSNFLVAAPYLQVGLLVAGRSRPLIGLGLVQTLLSFYTWTLLSCIWASGPVVFVSVWLYFDFL